MPRMSMQEYLRLAPDKKKSGNKFCAVRTEYNGAMFASKAEAWRAGEIDLLKKAGEVRSVEYQPKYECVVSGKKICTYIADFRLTYADGRVEVEDVKGLKRGSAYSVFRLKKKLTEALYGIEILEK